jgi:hypothetical protein
MNANVKKLTKREQRENFYRGEIADSSLSFGSTSVPVSVLDLNRHGAGVFVPASSHTGLTPEAPTSAIHMKSVSPGCQVVLSFRVDQGPKVELTGVVCNQAKYISSGSDGVRFGISFLASKKITEEVSAQSEQRKSKRVVIPNFFRPVGFCENPFKLLEQIHFHVLDCSADGISLVTSARNRVLVSGLSLRLTLFLPGLGTYIIQGTVSNVRESKEKNRLVVGFKFKGKEPEFLEAFVEMILMAGAEVSLKELKERGFPIGMAVKGLLLDTQETKRT